MFAASTREAPTISDTGGHTWTNRLSLGPLSSGTLFNIWTAPNSSTSATTITPNASSYYTLIAYEITGATYASVTGANRDTGLAASPAGGPTTAMVGDNGMGIFFICEDGEENLSSVTPTARSNQTHAWPKFAYAFGEVELDNGATLSASATASGTFPGWHVGLITFSAT